ncbi:putative benzoate 4-monooxygenase cytochrome [Rosellinia necatrix]|uniref:Putative benzoate 4-monooxygenase cytochrome n=1 Tax=Rosellinia necatrix TaxID=77044 RepID=A0A1S7UNR2_ROSNE|nr:putative benzoate 4-monooxygenase cytochrome [Rosellinia necatrix]
MAFELWKNHAEYTQFIVLLVFSPLSILVVAWRFVATYQSTRKPGLEDWMAVVAVIFSVLTNVGGITATSYLNGRSLEQEIAENPSDYRQTRRWDFAALYFYFIHILTVKLSVLALYYRIFGVNRAFRIWIYIIGSAQGLLVVLLSILHPLSCEPFNRYFDKSIPGTCRDDGLTILAGETPNSLIDIAMVILVLFMIRPLQLKSSTKWSLRVLLGMGVFVGIIGFIKIGLTYSAAQLYAFSIVSVWTSVQMFISMLCCCLPVIHHSLKRHSWQVSPSYISFKRFSRRTTQSHPTDASGSSSKPSDTYNSDQRNHNYEFLGKPSSVSSLAWPETAHHVEDYPLNDYSGGHLSSESTGIKVERQFIVARNAEPPLVIAKISPIQLSKNTNT